MKPCTCAAELDYAWLIENWPCDIRPNPLSRRLANSREEALFRSDAESRIAEIRAETEARALAEYEAKLRGGTARTAFDTDTGYISGRKYVKDEFGRKHAVESDTEKYFFQKAVEAKVESSKAGVKAAMASSRAAEAEERAETAEAEAVSVRAETKRAAAAMQAEIDDIRDQISGQGGEAQERIAAAVEKIQDLLTYGDAYVRKVGDFDPPKKPAP